MDVAGVDDQTQIAVFTDDGYNAVEYVNVGEDDFAIGGYGGSIPGEEKILTFDTISLSLVDNDLDAVDVDPIEITLNPEVVAAAAAPAALQAEPELRVLAEESEGVLLATDGDDTFAFTLAEHGSADTDVSITGFGDAGDDSLDLRDLLVGEYDDGADLTSYLNVTFDGTDTVIEVSSMGEFTNGDTTGVAVDQTITLEGVDLVGSDELSTVIQNMLVSGQLVTD